MASIRKHGNRWRAIIHRRSSRLYKSKVFSKKYDAEKWARQIEAEIDAGNYIDRSAAEETTLAEALDRYLNEISVRKKGNAVQSERSQARAICRFPIANMPLAKIRPADVSRFREARLKEVGPNSVRLALALISHLFTIAIREWDMDYLDNPVLKTRKPSVKNTARNRRLKKGEEVRLMAACKKYGGFIGPVVQLALVTGMRRGEIAGLRWDYIDLVERKIHLPDTKNNEARTVPLSSTAVSILTNIGKVRRIDGYVFGITPNAITRAFRRVCSRTRDSSGIKLNPLENLRFHDLRHEATSRFVESGQFSDVQVSEITGHKTLQMLKRYAHLRNSDLSILMDKAEANRDKPLD